jgi:hypothetical protein
MKYTAITTAGRAFDRGMIFEISYERAVPVPPLSTGDKVIVRLPDEGEMLLDVVAVEDGQAMVRTSKLGGWRLEEFQPGDLPKQLRVTYWQVSDRVSP